jgi:hypothetical protein
VGWWYPRTKKKRSSWVIVVKESCVGGSEKKGRKHGKNPQRGTEKEVGKIRGYRVEMHWAENPPLVYRKINAVDCTEVGE